jgi:hypothetical protein
MIEPASVNVRDLAIYRPRRVGAGGDTLAASDTAVYTAVPAYYERTHRVRRDGRTGEEIVVSGFFLLSPRLADGTPLDVRERDYLQHTDATGRLTAKMAALSVTYVHVGFPVDHIEIEV